MSAVTVTGRLAELAWQIYDGRHEDLRHLVEAQGGRWDEGPSGPVVRSVTGMTVGIPAAGADPVMCFVHVAYALFGEFWNHVPEVRDAWTSAIDVEWNRRAKAARAAEAGT